jgi:DNA-binding CsgD family transcriptional regulator/tetratricopeptide (TPR) repeat protein
MEAIPLLRSVTKDENPNLRAWGLELEAWIEKSRGGLPKAARLFKDVLDILAHSDARDELTRVSSLLGLCFIAVETTNATYFRRIVNESRTLVDTATTARLRVEVSYYVSIIHALEGSEASAFDVLLRARGISPLDPFSALPELELAAFHRRHGEAYAAKLHLGFARVILDRTSWADADVEALLLLAHYVIEAIALRETSAAGAAMKLLSIDGRRDPMLAMNGDPVAVAMALLARGNYYASVNKIDAALADFRQARTIWLERGYTYRAALASLALFRLGEQGALSSASSLTKAFPKSAIASLVRGARADAVSPVNALSAAERRVLDGICDGLTSKQIAARLKRSPATVRVQTASIFKKLGVNTRSAAIVAMASSNATRD